MSASVEKLKAARELIARPGGWTQDDFGRDAKGNPLYVTSGRFFANGVPCQVCALGALFAVGVEAVGFVKPAERLALERSIGSDRVADWNDRSGRTQEEVVAAFDKAIALAEAEAS